MQFGIGCILLVLSVAGIILLLGKMKTAPQKAGYKLEIVALALLAAVLSCYLALTALFVGSIA